MPLRRRHLLPLPQWLFAAFARAVSRRCLQQHIKETAIMTTTTATTPATGNASPPVITRSENEQLAIDIERDSVKNRAYHAARDDISFTFIAQYAKQAAQHAVSATAGGERRRQQPRPAAGRQPGIHRGRRLRRSVPERRQQRPGRQRSSGSFAGKSERSATARIQPQRFQRVLSQLRRRPLRLHRLP